MNRWLYVFLNALPILLMIGLIPLIKNDYFLSLAYILIIVIAFLIHRKPKDFLIFTFGLVGMIISEYIFVRTGVETFVRHSLLGLMPIWLPLLWGYGFVAIKRSVLVL